MNSEQVGNLYSWPKWPWFDPVRCYCKRDSFQNHSQRITPSHREMPWKCQWFFGSFFEPKRHKRPHPWWFQIQRMFQVAATFQVTSKGIVFNTGMVGALFSLLLMATRNPVNSPVDMINTPTIILLFTLQGFIHPRRLFGISEPSTVRPWSSNGDSIGKIRITPYIRDGHLTWKIEKSLNGYINPYHKGWWPSPTAGVQISAIFDSIQSHPGKPSAICRCQWSLPPRGICNHAVTATRRKGDREIFLCRVVEIWWAQGELGSFSIFFGVEPKKNEIKQIHLEVL